MENYLSTTAILDETPSAISRIATPWLGLFWLTNMPLRFVQVLFFSELFELGHSAKQYGYYFESLSFFVCLTFLIAIYGKAVFVRSCFLTLQSGKRVLSEGLRVRAAHLINFLYSALLIEILFYLLLIVFYISIPIFFFLAGLACVTAYRTDRPGLVEPLRQISSYLGNFKVIISLMFVYIIAFFVVFINLFLLLIAIVWAAGGIIGLDLARWEYLLRSYPIIPIPTEPLVRLICLAGTFLIVEPFLLASLSVYVHRSRLSETGEDLLLQLEKIKGVR